MPRAAKTDDRPADDSGVPYISKSKYLWGLQCPKLLWHAYHAKHLIAEPDAQQQAVFDQGHEVGALAKKLHPDGVEVGQGVSALEETVRPTQDALKSRRPLFEAAFTRSGGYCRVDILKPAPDGAWDVIEFKSTTSVKDVHLHDLAFQTWVLEMADLRIRRCFLLHINPDFVRRGPVDPKRFFARVELTGQVANLAQVVEDKLSNLFKVIRQPQHPDIKIGAHCDDPYTCPLHDHCWAFLPEHSVLDLYRGTKKGFDLLDQGVIFLKDIPDNAKLTENQAIQRQVAVTGQPHISKGAICEFLKRLRYPIHFLDFETFGTAIPLFDRLRPYQQVPFQFSLHVLRTPGAEPEQEMFLADGSGDPRPAFMLQLREAIGRQGSIVAFNAEFEKGRLRDCCEVLPNFAPWLAQIKGRFVDLL